MPALLKKVIRYYYQIKFLKPVQIYARLRQRLVRPQWVARPRAPALRTVPGEWCAPARMPHCRPGHNRFVILGQERTVDLPNGWHDRGPGKKWLMELHAFHSLWEDSPQDSADLILNWIAHNTDPQGPGWHPYITSQRICNWLKWSLAGNVPADVVRASIAGQVGYLLQVLNYDELDHKLLNNGKTLMFAGYLLDDEDSQLWRQRGWSLVKRYSVELLGGDGGYTGLSPMYHCALLHDLLDLANLLHAVAEPIPAYLVTAIESGLYWLACMCHPDGGIALFNDAAFNVAAEPAELEAYARRLGYQSIKPVPNGLLLLADSGFARMCSGPAVALLDVGEIGPHHAASHGHADTLTFEMSLSGKRLFVDTGLSTYEKLPERLQLRGTAAHNTVVLDNRNSSDVWGLFKVGRRAQVLDLSRDDSPSVLHIGAAHDGYRLPGNPLLHRRDWQMTGSDLTITDELSGRGSHRVHIIFHLHPGISVSPQGKNTYALRCADGVVDCVLQLDPDVDVQVLDYQYHPAFDRSCAATRLQASYLGPLPRVFTSQVRWDHPTPGR